MGFEPQTLGSAVTPLPSELSVIDKIYVGYFSFGKLVTDVKVGKLFNMPKL